MHEGFISHDLKLACYTDHQIFNRYHKYSLRSDRARAGQVALTLKELNSFKMGDYVVHIDHGVARFGGLIQIDANGKKQEVIKLLYKNDDLLLVSIHSLHKISRYKSKEGEAPTISKLGTSAWQNMKERTKKRLKDIASRYSCIQKTELLPYHAMGENKYSAIGENVCTVKIPFIL